MLKKLLAMTLTLTLLWTFCLPEGRAEETAFRGLQDAALRDRLEETIRDEAGQDYVVEEVQTAYLSQEYIRELDFNSQRNLYFGYTLAELDEQFAGVRYVFTLGENDRTVVKAFEADETDEEAIRTIITNTAMGAGVILVCVTVSGVAGLAGAESVRVIFAAAAKAGAVSGLTKFAGAFVKSVLQGYGSGSIGTVLQEALAQATNDFRINAIVGTVKTAMMPSDAPPTGKEKV